jgi:hypothetical protein
LFIREELRTGHILAWGKHDTGRDIVGDAVSNLSALQIKKRIRRLTADKSQSYGVYGMTNQSKYEQQAEIDFLRRLLAEKRTTPSSNVRVRVWKG